MSSTYRHLRTTVNTDWPANKVVPQKLATVREKRSCTLKAIITVVIIITNSYVDYFCLVADSKDEPEFNDDQSSDPDLPSKIPLPNHAA